MTECYQQIFGFQALGSRRVEADFSGGHLSSGGGVLLLRETDRHLGLCDKLARCFSNTRDERFVEHSLSVMIRQRVLGLALGYEDLNNHEQLRTDPLLAAACETARGEGREEPQTARAFGEFSYQTKDSWSRARRVIGKAEILGEKQNPRFIVTDLTGEEEWAEDLPGLTDGRTLYEKLYCARGDMENRIKEQQLDLFADRTSTTPFAGNQLRLWFSTFAYLLVARLRGIALQGTVLAKATAGTIRLRLFKVAASVVVSVRRVHVRMASAFPLQEIFRQACERLRT
jgi:hypothetical protein